MEWCEWGMGPRWARRRSAGEGVAGGMASKAFGGSASAGATEASEGSGVSVTAEMTDGSEKG